MQLWANDIKHRHIICHWKWFFVTNKNLRSLPKDKASFGSSPLSTFWQFVSKCVFWNLVTFVVNQVYHYDRGIERNLLEPRVATKNSPETVDQQHFLKADPRASIACNGGSPQRMPLGSHYSVSSEAPHVAHAVVGLLESIDWPLVVSMPREEREREIEIGR